MKLIKFFLIMILAVFPFGQILNLPRFGIFPDEVKIRILDLAVFGFVVSWIFWKWRRRKKINISAISGKIIFFFFVAALSLSVNISGTNSTELFVASAYLFRWMIYAGIFFALADLKGKAKEFSDPFLTGALILLGLSISVLAIGQYLFWPDIKFLEVQGWDPHYYRAVGAFLDPGFTGILLVLSLLVVFLEYNSRKALFSKRTLVLFFVFIYITLALTYSRSSYLTYLVGMGTISYLKKSWRIILAVVLFGIFTLLLLPVPAGEGGSLQRTYSIEARIESWENALIIAWNHPILGVGFNRYRYVQRDLGFLPYLDYQVNHAGAGADSSLLTVAATTGVVGLGAYLIIWLEIWKKINKDQNLKRRILVLSTLAVLLIHSQFLNSLFYPWVMVWGWIVFSMGSKLS